MALRQALVLIAGTFTDITTADTLAVGSGLSTTAGNLSIGSFAGTTTLSDVAVTVLGLPTFEGGVAASGASANDFSGGTGTFKTSTGAVTIGPGAVGVSGLATFSAGMAASGATANDLSGGTGAFKTSTGAVTIGPGAVTVSGATTFTAAGTAVTVNNNMTVTGTLTAGAIVSAGLVDSGFTTAAMTGGAGQAGYVSSASTVTPTDNATLAKSRIVGVYTGTAGQMQTDGVVNAMQFTTAGGSPGNGSPVYLAAATDDGSTGAGKFTATAPGAGTVVAEVGICIDNANYAGAKTAKIALQPKPPVQT